MGNITGEKATLQINLLETKGMAVWVESIGGGRGGGGPKYEK